VEVEATDPPATPQVEMTESSTTVATPPPSVTEVATTILARAEMSELGFVSCDRFGIGSPVSPDVARDYVPDDYELWLVDGNARFALQTMRCDDLVTDGVSHGPGHFGTVWIRIVGPEDAIALPPESDLVAQPTDSFHPPLFHTDNASFHAATTAFGVPMTLADSMTFDPPTPGQQTGAVTDREYQPPVDYRWSVDNVNRNDEGVGLGRHILLGHDDQGEPLTYYGEFAHEAGWMGNLGTLQFEPGSAFEDLVGTTLTAPANGDPITVDIVVFRTPT
jgi:hypothetical protein